MTETNKQTPSSNDLFSYISRKRATDFDGSTYNPQQDHARLNAQLTRVFQIMADGEWRIIPDIEAATGYPGASISARLRDFRKEKFGGHIVQRRRIRKGLNAYRLLLNKQTETAA